MGCNAMRVWQSYNEATDRISELAGKSTPGHFVTICGQGGTPPLEEFQGNLDSNNERDYSVLIAGPNDDFFSDRLLGEQRKNIEINNVGTTYLDDRNQENKSMNFLAIPRHEDWCTKDCPSSQITCKLNPEKK